MTSIKLSKLLYHLYDTALYTDGDIHGLALDSRAVKRGDLFFACKGTHLDGRQFIEEAIKNGAVAILSEVDSESIPFYLKDNIPVFPLHDLNQRIGGIAEKFYNSPSKKLKIIGITGTNGKTSCSYFIAEALRRAQIICGIIGTLGSGLLGNIKAGSLTTPDPITLHKTFADLVAAKAQAVAMEVSSHSIEQGRVNDIEYEVGVFTNLTRDHLDYHGTMEAYGAAKAKLFENPLTKYAVINADDMFGKGLLMSLPKEKVVAYSLDITSKLPVPTVYADQIELSMSGIRATVFTPWGKGEIDTPLIGQFNLSNVLAVLATLCLLKIPFDIALDCLKNLSPVPGRMQTLGGNELPLVVVDYAHTPDALEKVLIALRAHCTGKLYCLFGCGGDRDRGKRPLMAKIAERYADQVMVTDDNPRTENPEQIIADIMQGFSEKKGIVIQHDRSKAIRDIIQYAKKHDCILVAGKGAEMYQQIGNDKVPFSDVEKVKESLYLSSA